MHQKHWTFTQNEAATTWEINNVPANANGAVITHIESIDGQILQPDNQLKAPYGLQLSFGVEAVAGTAYGTYYVDDEDMHVEYDGNVVNITINQHPRP
jgi:hypothetical protein